MELDHWNSTNGTRPMELDQGSPTDGPELTEHAKREQAVGGKRLGGLVLVRSLRSGFRNSSLIRALPPL